MKFIRISGILVVLLLFSFALSACDGGGGGGNSSKSDDGNYSLTINCSNPGPNPVDENSPMQCDITATNGEPVLFFDDCGGTITGSGPWTYNFTPTEEQGPGTCVIAIEHSEDDSVKTGDLIEINEVNEPPENNAPDEVSGDELTLISFDVDPTDSDIPAQVLTSELVDATGACAKGALTDDEWSWTPTETDGPTSCDVVTKVFDGLDYSADVTTHIVVNEVNEAPVNSAPDEVSGDELTAISFNVNPTDADVPAQTLTCSQVSNGCAGGALVGCAWSWTPTEADGPTSCDVVTRVYDGLTYGSSVTTRIIVNEVNTAPVNKAPTTKTGNELTSISFSTSPTDSDIPVQTLTSSVVSATGLCVNGAFTGNIWSWTPTEEDGPTLCDVVTQVYDGVAYSSNVTTHVKVSEVNLAPVDNALSSVSGTVLNPINVDINPTDADVPEQTLTCYQVSNACPGGSLSGCSWSWTPGTLDGPTSCNVVTRVYDGHAYSSNKTTKIFVTDGGNTAPTNNAPATITGDELTAINFSTNPTDPESPPQTLTSSVVSATGACSSGKLSGHTWSWTPTEEQGPTSCDVVTRVYDGVDYSSNTNKTTHVIINEINQSPMWDVDFAPKDIEVRYGFVYDERNGYAIDEDGPNEALTDPGHISCVSTGDSCSFPINVIGHSVYGIAECYISFTAPNTVETCALTLKVEDGYGASITQNVSIDVTEPKIWYVNDDASGANDGSSWADAFNVVQDGASAATWSDQVWVAEGTYVATGEALIGMKTGVDIYGGFEGTESSLSERILSAYESVLDGGSISSHVILGKSNGRLDGFTIVNSRGSGMYNGNVEELEVANCKFQFNKAGGIYNTNSSLTISNCAFMGNSAVEGGGIYNSGYSSPLIINSVFIGNIAVFGGGIYNGYSSNPIVTNCTFTGNIARSGGGGAVYNGDGSFLKLFNSILWNDIACYGNEIYNGEEAASSVTYSDIKLLAGSVYTGTGNINSDPLFSNAPIFLDYATSVGTVNTLKVWNASLYYVDDIIEIEKDGVIRTVTGASGITVTFSPALSTHSTSRMIIENWGPGVVNLTEDLHLPSDSPAVNTGTNTGAPAYDLDGNPRPSPVGGIVDMGAYEYIFSLSIDCSPNPANENTSVNCVVNATSTPEKDSTNDTCGGSITGSGPWVYSFYASEFMGPMTCKAAVRLVADSSVKSNDVVTINEVNTAPHFIFNGTSGTWIGGLVIPNPITHSINGGVEDHDWPAMSPQACFSCSVWDTCAPFDVTVDCTGCGTAGTNNYNYVFPPQTNETYTCYAHITATDGWGASSSFNLNITVKSAITIDCSPNPADENTTVNCAINAVETPIVDSTNDTCGGSISGSGPWVYSFIAGEEDVPSCNAAVELYGSYTSGLKSSDVVNVTPTTCTDGMVFMVDPTIPSFTVEECP